MVDLPLFKIPLFGSPPVRGTIPIAIPRKAPQMYQQEAIFLHNQIEPFIYFD